jgi:hypothetical protein
MFVLSAGALHRATGAVGLVTSSWGHRGGPLQWSGRGTAQTASTPVAPWPRAWHSSMCSSSKACAHVLGLVHFKVSCALCRVACRPPPVPLHTLRWFVQSYIVARLLAQHTLCIQVGFVATSCAPVHLQEGSRGLVLWEPVGDDTRTHHRPAKAARLADSPENCKQGRPPCVGSTMDSCRDGGSSSCACTHKAQAASVSSSPLRVVLR